MEIKVFTDGASSFAGTTKAIAGWAMVVPDLKGTMFVRYGHLPGKTSNQGEIFGVYYAMVMLHKKKDIGLDIYSDSQYTIKSINEWRKKWALTFYDGIKNTNLLIPLFDMWDYHGNSKISWVKGHADHPGNIMADKYAVMGKKQQIENRQEMGYDIRYVDFNETEMFF